MVISFAIKAKIDSKEFEEPNTPQESKNMWMRSMEGWTKQKSDFWIGFDVF